jgi:hypothetical protein
MREWGASCCGSCEARRVFDNVVQRPECEPRAALVCGRAHVVHVS